jgi:hypothetical protein
MIVNKKYSNWFLRRKCEAKDRKTVPRLPLFKITRYRGLAAAEENREKPQDIVSVESWSGSTALVRLPPAVRLIMSFLYPSRTYLAEFAHYAMVSVRLRNGWCLDLERPFF